MTILGRQRPPSRRNARNPRVRRVQIMAPEQTAAQPELPEIRGLIELGQASCRALPTIEDGQVVEVRGVQSNNPVTAQCQAGRSSRAIVEASQPRTPAPPMVRPCAPVGVTHPPPVVTSTGFRGGR
jgi:hypothetical protein